MRPQRIHHVATPQLQERDAPEDHGHRSAKGSGKRNRRPSDLHVTEPSERQPRSPAEALGDCDGERDACRSPEATQHGDLGGQLTEQLAHRGAERRSHLHFATAAARAHEQQICDVHAGHEERASHGGKQQKHGQSRVARDQNRQRCDVLREDGHPLPFANRQSRLPAFELGLRAIGADFRPKTADDGHEPADIAIPVNDQRKIHVNWCAREQASGKRELRRHDADDRVGCVVDRE